MFWNSIMIFLNHLTSLKQIDLLNKRLTISAMNDLDTTTKYELNEIVARRNITESDKAVWFCDFVYEALVELLKLLHQIFQIIGS